GWCATAPSARATSSWCTAPTRSTTRTTGWCCSSPSTRSGSRARRSKLVHLDVGLLNHPAPALDVRLDDRAKLLRRTAFRGHAVGGEQVSHVLRLQHFVGVAVEAVHDRRRHASGGHQAVP